MLSVNALLRLPQVTPQWLMDHLGRGAIPGLATLLFPSLSLAAKRKVCSPRPPVCAPVRL